MKNLLRITCLASLLGLVGLQTGCVNSASSAYRVRSAHDFEVVETSTKRTLTSREMAALRAKVGAYLADQGETGYGDFYVKIFLGEEPGIAKGEWVVVRYSRYSNTRYGTLASSPTTYYGTHPFSDYPYGRFSFQYYDYPYYPYYDTSRRYSTYPPYYPPSTGHRHHGNGDRDRDHDRPPGSRPDHDRPGQRPDRPSPGSGVPAYATPDLTQTRRSWTPRSNPETTRTPRPVERENPRYQGRDRNPGADRSDYRSHDRRSTPSYSPGSSSRRDANIAPVARPPVAPAYQSTPSSSSTASSSTDTTTSNAAPTYTPPATRSNPEPVERQRPAANDGGRRARQF